MKEDYYFYVTTVGWIVQNAISTRATLCVHFLPFVTKLSHRHPALDRKPLLRATICIANICNYTQTPNTYYIFDVEGNNVGQNFPAK